MLADHAELPQFVEPVPGNSPINWREMASLR